VGLPRVELTPFAGADNSSSVDHRCWPVESLSEGDSNKGSRRCVMAASPRVYLLQELLAFGDGNASLEDARGAAVVELLPVSQQDERLGAPRQPPSFGLVEGQLPSVEILQVWGPPALIRRDLAWLLLDTQCLTLGGRGYLGPCQGYLGLGRGYLGLSRRCLRCLGLGRVLGLDGGLMQVSGEYVRGNCCSSRGYSASSSAVSL
jgi:hypothetical protein